MRFVFVLPEGVWIWKFRGWLHETGMNSDRDEVRSLQRHYMRPGRKSRVITWDRHEMRRQLKVFHIQSTFSMLHIGRWPFRYKPNHHGRSSTAGHVFRNVSFCNGMCYTFKCFFCFPFAILRATANFCPCQTADAVLRGHKNFDRSENFCDYLLSRSKVDPVWDFRFGLSTVVPVWVKFLYRSHVIR